ncbi:MAG: hypothetical protein LBS58_03665, partial [Coriobacteriales bacterium]|nr:hypothetical protein [Coriobacteriales bacterium]
MADETGLFTRDRILYLFNKLDKKMRDKDMEADVFVVGGAAIALTVNDSRVTSDIDSKYENPNLDPLIYEIAAEEGLSTNWMNHSVTSVLSYFKKDTGTKTIFAERNLRIHVASPEYVLAMK